MNTKLMPLLVGAIFLMVPIAGCTENSQSTSPTNIQAQPTQEKEVAPSTPAEAFTQAMEKQDQGKGYSFQMKGGETLTLKASGTNQSSSASYQADVDVLMKPYALQSNGTIISKGKRKPEQIYVVGDEVYMKVGKEPWESGLRTSPDFQDVIEDPTQIWDGLTELSDSNPDLFTMKSENNQYVIELTLTNQEFQSLQSSEEVKKIQTEVASTIKQLKKLGFQVSKKQLKLTSYKQTVVLDQSTLQLKKHSIDFKLSLPAGKQTFTFKQKVEATSTGLYEGEIVVPAEAR